MPRFWVWSGQPAPGTRGAAHYIAAKQDQEPAERQRGLLLDPETNLRVVPAGATMTRSQPGTSSGRRGAGPT